MRARLHRRRVGVAGVLALVSVFGIAAGVRSVTPQADDSRECTAGEGDATDPSAVWTVTADGVERWPEGESPGCR